MLESVKNVFRVKDLRKRLFFVLMMIVVIRLGSQLPVPGTDSEYFKQWFASQSGDAFNFFDAFTGGSFEQFSIFALNITPYITSSIIIQLLTIAIPKLEEMQRDGEDGRKKLAAITRYVTVALSLVEGIAMAIGFGRQGLIPVLASGSDASVLEKIFAAVVVVACLTAGSAMLMWIGERITENGVGNGISIVLTVNIVSRMPSDFTALYESFIGCSCICTHFKWCREKNSRTVFQKDAGTKDGRWTVYTYSAEGQHRRCYPDYLCIIHYVLPKRNCFLYR